MRKGNKLGDEKSKSLSVRQGLDHWKGLVTIVKVLIFIQNVLGIRVLMSFMSIS